MVKGKQTIRLAFLWIMILALPISIAVAASIGYQTYLPIIYRYASPSPTLTPIPSATPTPTLTIFPSATPTYTPTPTRTPTQPPQNTGNVVITYIFYNGAGDLEPDEYVEIRNDDNFPIQLANWTLRDIANHNYTFPNYIIQTGQICRIYTNENHPEWCGFNYGSATAIWNNDGDCAYLRDSFNTLIDEYCYP